MKRLIFVGMMVGVFALAAAPRAEATVILNFGQTGDTNTITGVANGGGTATTITGTNVPVNITQIENGVPVSAFFNLTATSTGPVTGGLVAQQNFSGTFSITSLAGGGGTNYLSGSFTDVTAGLTGGGQLTMLSAQPPVTLSFTSDVVTSLGLGRALSLSFTNVTPVVGTTGTTLSSFTSSVAGNFSANVGQVPEPGSMLLLGSGLLGIAAVVRRRVARKS